MERYIAATALLALAALITLVIVVAIAMIRKLIGRENVYIVDWRHEHRERLRRERLKYRG